MKWVPCETCGATGHSQNACWLKTLNQQQTQIAVLAGTATKVERESVYGKPQAVSFK